MRQLALLDTCSLTCTLTQMILAYFLGHANSAAPDQPPLNAASDQSRHCSRTECSIKM